MLLARVYVRRTSKAHWGWKVAVSSASDGTTPDAAVRSQYARNSTSASSSASFPRLVGNRVNKPALSLSVMRELEVLRMVYKSSSRRTLMDRRASLLSLNGRISERITSAECEEI